MTEYGSGKVFIRARRNYFPMFNSLFNPPFETLVNLTIRLLDNLKIKVSSSTINKALHDHPEYPSLLSVVDALNQWNVKNMAIKVDPSRINELPLPFLAHKEAPVGDHFELVTNLTENKIEYFDNANKKKTISIDNFQKTWSGIVLLAEASEDSGEFNYLDNLKRERISALIPFVYPFIGLLITTMCIVALTLSQIENNILVGVWVALLITKYFGILITIPLISTEVDQQNSFLNKVCGSKPKNNCMTVLQSKGAQIIPGLSWSEIGFFYYAGGWLLICISTFSFLKTSITFLFILNLMALPYVLYSIYYQSKVVRQWCKVCLIVLAMIVVEFGLLNLIGFSNLITYLEQFNIAFITSVLLAFTIPIIIWYIFKFRLIQLREKKEEVQQLKKIKFNIGVFLHLLESQPKMLPIPQDVGIVLQSKKRNNSKPYVHILQVWNLYCSACAHSQSFIEELIEKTENLKIQIVFGGTQSYDKETQLILNHILKIAENIGEQEVNNALGDWYKNKEMNYDAFATKYPIRKISNLKSERIENMNQWCEKANIKYTPSYFINGQELPEGYYIEDLKYFLSTDIFWR